MEKSVANAMVTKSRQVLYLTVLENDVWESILSAVEDIDGVPRLSVPNTPERLIERWRRPGLTCTKREYSIALERFIDAGFIVPINTHTQRADGYRLTIDPDHFLVRVIRKRIPLYFDGFIISNTLEHLKRYEDTSVPLPSFEDLKELLSYEQPEPSACGMQILGYQHLIWMYVGGIPHTSPTDVSPSNARGLFFKFSEEDRYIPCHPSFMPFRYYDLADQPVFVAHLYLMPDTDGSNKPLLVVPNDRRVISVSDGLFDDTGELSGHLFDRSDLEEICDADLSMRMEVCETIGGLIASGSPALKEVLESREAERRRIAEELAASLQRQRHVNDLRQRIEAMQQELSLLEAD